MSSKNNKLWLRNIVALVAVSLVLAVSLSIADTYTPHTSPTLDGITSDTQITAVSASDTRTTIGLKEKVDCSIDPDTWEDEDCENDTDIVYDSLGTKTWTAIGSGGTVSPSTGNSTVLTADDDPGAVTVKFTGDDSGAPNYHTGEEAIKTKAFTVIAPDGENSEIRFWDIIDPSMLVFRAQLTPTTVSFGNISVEEQDGCCSHDGCWFSGSSYAKSESVLGEACGVGNDNYWQSDVIGWYSSAITYYRANPTPTPSAPCNTFIGQDMHVVEGSSGVYAQNGLIFSIDTTTIEVERAGVSASKTWP